jgi:hypothetical protein
VSRPEAPRPYGDGGGPPRERDARDAHALLGIWLQQRQQPARAPAAATAPAAGQPAEQRFPLPIVVLHGVLAVATLALVVLTAAGVGGS